MMQRVPVTITRKRALVPAWAAAQVPWKRVIWVREGVHLSQRMLAHELRHVIQAEQHAWPLMYFVQWALTGFSYTRMPFEVEARAAETDPVYLQWAADILGGKA